MGNCQAAEAAAVVIQHPGGKVERLYGPTTAGDVMRSNPGHYVALVVLRVSAAAGVGGNRPQDPAVAGKGGGGGATRITKVKLLKPKDGLLLGQVYRLITSQDVAKAIEARRQDKTRRVEEAIVDDDDQRHHHRSRHEHAAGSQDQRQERHDERKRSSSSEKADRHRISRGGGRHWQPSLQSISEFPAG